METNGFYNLSVKGKYIYCTWNQGHGTEPVIVGNKIVYQQCKLMSDKEGFPDWRYTLPTGKTYSMKLNGSGKEKVKAIQLKKMSGIVYPSEEGVCTDNINGYIYYIIIVKIVNSYTVKM